MSRPEFSISDPDDHTVVSVIPSHFTHMGDNRPYVSIVHPRGKASRHPITSKGLLIGRGRHADVVLDDAQVSRRHCLIRLTDAGIVAEDLGSTNGTHINGNAITLAVVDPSGRIKIGGCVLRVEYRARVEINAEKQLEQAAQTDELTGLNNRRWFFGQSAAYLASAADSGHDLTLVMIDIDHFKQINDSFGHAAGDHVLKEVAQILTAQKREDDSLARFGGEEFVMLLPDTGATDALVFCDGLCEAVKKAGISVNGRDLFVQVSIGTWTEEVNQITSIEQAISGADAAMYRAKRAGRNRVSD
ncbi:MAG: GGDEF domain-containing protein [Gammaproteobacteria bacterium]